MKVMIGRFDLLGASNHRDGGIVPAPHAQERPFGLRSDVVSSTQVHDSDTPHGTDPIGGWCW
ncbi:MAG: hypothetical protein D6695_11780 [Planctomycetota bacterium]|nr:MAG: hypothetical protein D6695_11780 [Planctomycetota bacterium]